MPWTLKDKSLAENPAAMFSVGSVPMWDGSPLASNPKYPSDAYAQQLLNADPGSPLYTSWAGGGDSDNSGGCNPDDELLACSSDSDCASILPSRISLRCVHGVCAVADSGTESSCYSHRDCQASDKLCSGDGLCVDPILQVLLMLLCALSHTHITCLTQKKITG